MLTGDAIDRIVKRVNGRHIVYVYDKGRIREFTGTSCSRTHAKVFSGLEKRVFKIESVFTTREECSRDTEGLLISNIRRAVTASNRPRIKSAVFDLCDFWIRNRLYRKSRKSK